MAVRAGIFFFSLFLETSPWGSCKGKSPGRSKASVAGNIFLLNTWGMKGQAPTACKAPACTDDVRVRGSFQDYVEQPRAAALRVAFLDVVRSSQSSSWKLEALGLQISSSGSCKSSLGEGWCWEVRISSPPSGWEGDLCSEGGLFLTIQLGDKQDPAMVILNVFSSWIVFYFSAVQLLLTL